MKYLLSLSLFCCFSLSAQQFTKLYKVNNVQNTTAIPIAEVALMGLPMADGGYLIVGTMPTPQGGGSHTYLLKINGNGDSLWSKSYDFMSTRPFKFYKDGDYKIAVSATLSGPDERAIIFTVDSLNGDTLSTQTLAKHPNANTAGTYFDMELLPDGSMILAFRDNPPGGGAAADVGHTYKINANGSVGWQFEHDGTNASYQYFHDLYWDGSNIIATGMEVAGSNNYIGEWVVTALDTAGTVQWTTTLESPNSGWGYRWLGYGNSIVQNAAGEYLVGGGYKYTDPLKPTQATVVRFSATGDSLGSSTVYSSRTVSKLIPATSGNGFVATGTGVYVDSSNFNKYYDKAMLAAVDNNGIFGAFKLSGDTNNYSSGFGQSEAAYSAHFAIPASGNNYLVMGTGFKNSVAHNHKITYLFGQSAPATVSLEKQRLKHAALLPNPAQDYVKIQLSHGSNYPAQAEIFDLNGRKIKTLIIEKGRASFIGDLSSGLYLVKIEGYESQKLRVD